MPFTIPLGTKIPHFSLLATDGKTYTQDSFSQARILVVFFTCNHCPYVLGSDEITRKTAEHFQKKGVVFVGINANSKDTYKEDSFEHMIERMQIQRFPWTYLHDATQEVAKRFGALRTPHFFVFDEARKLIYCGRAVDSPKDSSKITINDLEKALNEHLLGGAIQTPLTNPLGCNVKWQGEDKHWMPPEACDLVKQS